MIYVFLAIILVVGTLFLSFSNANLVHYYDRKLPKEKSTICMYYYNGKFNGKEFYLTLLELIDNGIYKLENISNKKYLVWNKDNMFSLENLNLKPYEKKVVMFINSLIYEENKAKMIDFDLLKEKIKLFPTLNKTMEDFYTLLKSEISNLYGYVVNDYKYQKVVIFNFMYLLLSFLLTSKITFKVVVMSLLLSFIFMIVSTVFINTKNVFKSTISIILYAIVYIAFITFMLMFTIGIYAINLPLFLRQIYNDIPLFIKIISPFMIISNFFMLKYSKRFNKKEQMDLYLNLVGLRNFMIEFTNTSQKPIDYINFLDKYYVLAVALDVNLKYPDYIKSVYDDDTIHTFDSNDLMESLENLLGSYAIKKTNFTKNKYDI